MCTLANNVVPDKMPHYVPFPHGIFYLLKVMKKAKIREQFNQVPCLTQDTTWKSDKNTRKNYIQESQEVIPFPAGNQKAARNRQSIIKRQTQIQILKKINKGSTTSEQSVRKLLEGLNMYDGTNLTLISDVNQDT